MEKLILTGNLGHAATLHDVETPSGPKQVVNFTVAVRRGWGERETTQWYGCAWWGDRAAKAAPYLVKGKRVLLEGTPDVRVWKARETGEPRGEIALSVHFCEFIGAASEAKPTATTEPAGEDVPY